MKPIGRHRAPKTPYRPFQPASCDSVSMQWHLKPFACMHCHTCENRKHQEWTRVKLGSQTKCVPAWMLNALLPSGTSSMLAKMVHVLPVKRFSSEEMFGPVHLLCLRDVLQQRCFDNSGEKNHAEESHPKWYHSTERTEHASEAGQQWKEGHSTRFHHLYGPNPSFTWKSVTERAQLCACCKHSL